MSELVLVIRTRLLHHLGYFQGYTLQVDRYLPQLFSVGNSTFISRDRAESDPSFKQLIPYVVLAHNSSVFSYVRGSEAGEQRLVSKRSVGLGGHIHPLDETLFTAPADIYREAAKREVEEEVRIKAEYQERIIALINDDSDDVGRVHLGIVHLWTLTAPLVRKRERQITQSGFVDFQELQQLEPDLETWSRIALEAVKGRLIG